MKGRSCLTIIFILLFTACTQELVNRNEMKSTTYFDSIYASFLESKTTLNSNWEQRWAEGDCISIYPGRDRSSEYMFTGEESEQGYVFKRSGDGYFGCGDSDKCVAIYPAEGGFPYDEGDGLKIIAMFEAIQQYHDKSFSPSANLMYAVNENFDDNHFFFKNLGGYLVVRLYGDAIVTSIVLKGNNGEILSGQALYDVTEEKAMEDRWMDGRNTITIECKDGVRLSSSEKEATEFWFVCPPVVFEKGFTVTAYNEMKREIVLTTTENREIQRSVVNTMDVVEAVFPTDPAIVLPDSVFNLTGDCDTLDIPVFTPLSLEVEVSSEDSWLKFQSYDKTNHIAHFTMEANTTSESRFAKVHFSNKESGIRETASVTQWRKGNFVCVGDEIEVPYDFKQLEFDCMTDARWVDAESAGLSNDYSQGKVTIWRKNMDFRGGVRDTTFIVTFREMKDTVMTQDLRVKVNGNMATIQKEREVLEHFYNSTNGPAWTNHTSWCSDLPVGEWFGVTINRFGEVIRIMLDKNNLSGELDTGLTKLEYVTELYFSRNGLTGILPVEFSMMKSLEYIDLEYNNLYGELPESWASIPSIQVCYNQLSGDIPSAFLRQPEWNSFKWDYIMRGNGYSLRDYPVYPELYTTTDIYGKDLNFQQIVHDNKYTAIFHWDTGCTPSLMYYPVVMDAYDIFHDFGFEVVGWDYLDKSLDTIIDRTESFCTKWQTTRNYPAKIVSHGSPALWIFDQTGRLVYDDNYDEFRQMDLVDFLRDNLGDVGVLYSSKDYSKDGICKQLQSASVGKGINVVIIGDGFVDEDIESGEYDEIMSKAAEAFFSEEPLKSLRDRFNVWSIYSVSQNRLGRHGAKTTFMSQIVNSTFEDTDCRPAIEYAEKNGISTDNAVFIIMVNSGSPAGISYMDTNTVEGPTEYDNGLSCSFAAINDKGEGLRSLVVHEAAGHGFGKLADEYVNDDSRIPDYQIEYLNYVHLLGVYRNVDVANDPDKVLWNKFLVDDSYASDGLGVFEGGYTYRYGVYRPTEKSIMTSDVGESFNAPSRENIYIRAMKLSEGPDWQYDFETFKSFDAKNHKTTEQTKAKVRRVLHTSPPVIIGNHPSKK